PLTGQPRPARRDRAGGDPLQGALRPAPAGGPPRGRSPALPQHAHQRRVPRRHPRRVAHPGRERPPGRASGAVPGRAAAAADRALHLCRRPRPRPVPRLGVGGGGGGAGRAALRRLRRRPRLRGHRPGPGRGGAGPPPGGGGRRRRGGGVRGLGPVRGRGASGGGTGRSGGRGGGVRRDASGPSAGGHRRRRGPGGDGVRRAGVVLRRHRGLHDAAGRPGPGRRPVAGAGPGPRPAGGGGGAARVPHVASARRRDTARRRPAGRRSRRRVRRRRHGVARRPGAPRRLRRRRCRTAPPRLLDPRRPRPPAVTLPGAGPSEPAFLSRWGAVNERRLRPAPSAFVLAFVFCWGAVNERRLRPAPSAFVLAFVFCWGAVNERRLFSTVVAVERPGGGRIADKTPPGPADLVVVEGLQRTVPLHRLAAGAWAALTAAARAAGHSAPLLLPVSGYRSAEEQAWLWDAALVKYGDPDIAELWVARPGTSAHQSGRAIDCHLGDPIESEYVDCMRQLPVHRWL